MSKITKGLLVLSIMLIGITECLAADVYLYVTRHGKTMFNTVERAQGWADTPLTAEGIDVAKKLGRGLKPVDFAEAWSSDAGRARETARLVMEARDKPLVVREQQDLREVGFGLFEGDLDENMWGAAAKQAGYSSREALMEDFAKRRITIVEMINAIKAAESSGTAESYQQVAERMTTSITTIARDVQQKGGGNVLIVSHGMAIMVLLHEIGDKSLNHPLANASVTKLRYTDAGKFIIESINDQRYVAHGS